MAITITFKEAQVRQTAEWYEGKVITNHNNTKHFKGTFPAGANPDAVIAQAIYDTFIALRTELEASLGTGWTDDGYGNYSKVVTAPTPTDAIVERTINTITPLPPTPRTSTITVRMYVDDGSSTPLTASVNAAMGGTGGVTTISNTPCTVDVCDKQSYSVTVTPPTNYQFSRWGNGVLSTTRSGTYSIANGPLSFTAYATLVQTPPPTSPTVTPKPVGLYIPDFDVAIYNAVLAMKAEVPSIPLIVGENPASGPGDEYTGHTGPRSDIQNRINTLKGLQNTKVVMYTGSWYARCLNSPVEGSKWEGSHYGVVYTQDKTQYDSIIAAGGKAIYLPEVIDKCAGIPVNGKVWYTNLDGLFIDEVDNSGNTAKIAWYNQLIDNATSKGLSVFVGNPGASSPTAYFTGNKFTNLLIRENVELPTISAMRSINGNGTYKDVISFIAHSTTLSTITETAIKGLCAETAYMYVTDDLGSPENPYNNPPTNFVQIARWIDEYNRSIGAY